VVEEEWKWKRTNDGEEVLSLRVGISKSSEATKYRVMLSPGTNEQLVPPFSAELSDIDLTLTQLSAGSELMGATINRMQPSLRQYQTVRDNLQPLSIGYSWWCDSTGVVYAVKQTASVKGGRDGGMLELTVPYRTPPVNIDQALVVYAPKKMNYKKGNAQQLNAVIAEETRKQLLDILSSWYAGM
jgi:hypothetical protein